MRRLFLLALLAAPPAHGEIRSAADCTAAVAADPAAAREDAALWQRTGGGVPARLCEAAALSALGANATAARLLTNLAENPNRAISRPNSTSDRRTDASTGASARSGRGTAAGSINGRHSSCTRCRPSTAGAR